MSKVVVFLFVISVFLTPLIASKINSNYYVYANHISLLNDFDADGILDKDDPRPTVPDAPNADPDHDGKPNKTDDDDDGDGTLDTDDVFPWDKDDDPSNNGNGPAPVIDTPSNTTTQPPTNTLDPNDSANSTALNTKTTYTPLAPLTEELAGPYDTTGDCPLGRYLSIMFKLFMGIAAVLAMIMIFAGGIEYMTSELISSKESGMSKVKNAIGGLLLALAAYLILNEINPKLLNICLGNIPKASIVVEEDDYVGGVVPPDSPYNGPAKNCPEGIISVSTKGGNFNTCKNNSDNLKKLVDDAWAAGVHLSGGGFRTYDQQIQARIKNCGGNSNYNIYQKPNTDCHPPTALPGTSRHESGKAFDFTCDGSLIRSTDNACFIWLKKNAGKYLLYNYPAENWHWSVDGK